MLKWITQQLIRKFFKLNIFTSREIGDITLKIQCYKDDICSFVNDPCRVDSSISTTFTFFEAWHSDTHFAQRTMP